MADSIIHLNVYRIHSLTKVSPSLEEGKLVGKKTCRKATNNNDINHDSPLFYGFNAGLRIRNAIAS
jgi:hypothetical protein